MKELRNGIKIIGIDHGYGNIKTASTVTPTGIMMCPARETIFWRYSTADRLSRGKLKITTRKSRL